MGIRGTVNLLYEVVIRLCLIVVCLTDVQWLDSGLLGASAPLLT